jgi:hypothetical protein
VLAAGLIRIRRGLTRVRVLARVNPCWGRVNLGLGGRVGREARDWDDS